MKKTLTTYANNVQEANIMRNKAKIAKKRPLSSKRVKVQLYRASSHSPIKISNSAKEAFSSLKKEIKAPEKTFIRIDTRETGVLGEQCIDISFDDRLAKDDTVYYSNKMLFILDRQSAIALVGQTLHHDRMGYWLDSPYGLPVDLDPDNRAVS